MGIGTPGSVAAPPPRRPPQHDRGRGAGVAARVVLVLVTVGLVVLSAVSVLGVTDSGPGPARLASVAGPAPAPAPSPQSDALVQIGADRAECPATVVACVDTRLQLTWLQRGGAIVYGPVEFAPGEATGLEPAGPSSTATPLGRFAVGRKNATEWSSEFHEAMPDAVYFAPGGIAFHAGTLGGASHGCVHLAAPDAVAYFNGLQRGDPVLVF